jgi:hypothetical protein
VTAIGLPWWRPWIARLALAAACAFLVLAGILGVTARIAQRQLAEDLQRSHQVAAVLTAPDATMLDARVTTGGTATVVMSRRQRALVFAATGLRTLPSSQCNELWLLGPGQDKPAGMLPTARYFELIGSGLSGSEASQRVGVSLSCGSVWFIDAGRVTFMDVPVGPRFLGQDDRIEIAGGLVRGEPVKAIAVRIGKSYQSVCREIARNRKPDGRYQPCTPGTLPEPRKPTY